MYVGKNTLRAESVSSPALPAGTRGSERKSFSPKPFAALEKRRSLRKAEASSIRGRDDCSRVYRGGKERDIIPAADSGRVAARAPSQAAASHRAS